MLAISKGILHPTIFCRNLLKEILLSAVDGTALELSSDLNKLDGLDINMFRAVVLFFHEKEISLNQLNALITFVESGGRLFCIHGALASFKAYDEYRKLTGARFTGHDKIRDMHITGDLDFVIRDELYEFKIEDECDVRLDCDGVPVLWTRILNNGRVTCLSPGHRAATFKNSGFRKLLESIIYEILELNGGMNEKS